MSRYVWVAGLVASLMCAELGAQGVDSLTQEVAVSLEAGDRATALRTARRAVDSVEQMDETAAALPALRSLADQLTAMGSHSGAAKMLSRGVSIAERVEPDVLPGLLEAAGNAHGSAENHAEARKAFAQLLAMQTNSADRARTQVSLLKAMIRDNADESALRPVVRDFESATRRGGAAGLCDAHLEMAAALLMSPHAQAFADTIARSLELARDSATSAGQRSNVAGFQAGLAHLRGDWAGALTHARQALAVTLSEDLPQLAYRWHWQMGRTFAATGQRSEAIAAYQRAVTALEEIQSELAKLSYVVFRERVLPVYNELIDLLLAEAMSAPAGSRVALLEQVRATVEGFNRSELLDYFDDNCVLPTNPMSLDTVTADTAVIYSISLHDRLVVVALIAGEMDQHVYPVEQSDFDQLVDEFYLGLAEGDGVDDLQDLGAELHEMLVGPITARLERAKVKRLVFIPAPALRKVPMAALYDGEHYLIEQYDIAVTLGLDLTARGAFASETLGDSAMQLLAGVSDGVQQLDALPGVAKELQLIQETVGGRVAINEGFTLDRATGHLGEGGYTRVHLATHGYFGAEAADSWLLTFDQKLTLNGLEDSIGKRRYLGQPLDLLVLSACETAEGNDRAALGLAGVSLKAGARTTVATLWPISDAATSILMPEFYKNLDAGMGTTAALRSAQRKLIADPVYGHPNFWSPFLLIGNWL